MKLKIKLGFIDAFIMLIALLIVIDLYVDYFEEISREEKSFNLHFEQTSNIITSEITQISTTTIEAINISQRLYDRKKLDFTDYKLLNALFMPIMRAHPYITSINYGDEKGNGYLILNYGNIWKNRIRRITEPGKVTWIELTEDGDQISKKIVADDYDPRKRPWYEIAKENRSINWSSPYIFRTTRDIGITASYNLSSENNKKAIIGLDIMLKDLSTYLHNINTKYKDAKIGIISQDGKIIASSDKNFKDFLKKDDVDLLTLTADRDEVLYNAFKTFLEKRESIFRLKLNNDQYYVSVKNCAFSSTDKLYMIITLPEYVFLAHYKEVSKKRTIIYFLIITIASMFFAKRYLVPLKRLTQSIMSFPYSNYSPLPYTDRNDEIGDLSNTFNNMAKELEKQSKLLELSEKSYRLLFESNPLPFLIINEENMKIVKANGAALKLYGYDKDKFLNLSLADIEFQTDTSVALKINGTTKGIVTHKKADGSRFAVEIHSNAIEWEDKKAILMLCIDISQRLILEEQLRHAKKMESIGTLAGGIAHDFNNILAAILGHATLLELKMPNGDPLLKNVKDIIISTDRAAGLVSQMLAFGRKQIFNLQEYDLNAVIEEFLPTLQMLLGNDNIIETVFSSTPLKVKVDKNQLGQVLMNLATNAKDAMPNGGKVIIFTNKVLIKNEVCPDLTDGEYALIQFSDNGVGMTEETTRRIFDPFFTTKEVGKGTGLGLSVIYGIIKQHKGDIQVKSVLNKGTSFYIYLPLVKMGGE